MPFLVNKLSVKVLPCVIGFVEGVSKMKFVSTLTLLHHPGLIYFALNRLVGFDELEGGDDFNTKTLEIGMVHCGKLSISFLDEVYLLLNGS